MDISTDRTEEIAVKAVLEKRQDPDALRIKRFLQMPDLTRTPESPLYELVQRVKRIPALRDFDEIKIPEIVPTRILFDLFNMPPGHPARSKSDTYYATENHVLITHDTVMWYYYFKEPRVQTKMARGEDLAVICYTKVYRKDEIDRHHMNVFHQFGGLFLVKDSKRKIALADLKEVLGEIARSIFGAGVEYNFTPETFPYTDPSVEMNIRVKNEWVEMVGSGLPRQEVLANFGVRDYNGWAFGFGLERLAMVSMDLPDIRLLWSQDPRVKNQLKLDHKYKEVSKYPPIIRDISFVVRKNFVPNNYFDLIRDLGGVLIEQVILLDKYENPEKFGADKISYTYRIIYRAMERTLTEPEIETIQKRIRAETEKQFQAVVR